MAVGRITGPLLKANLLRQGANLAFETDLLYLDVVNGRIGVKTAAPSTELQINGTTRTTNLEVTTQADIASFTVSGSTISSTNSTISLEPSGTNGVLYQGKLVVNNNMQITEDTISTTAANTNLTIATSGTGQVNINSNVLVNGDLHATGTITADGNIQIGDDNTDNIVFNADINSNIVPDITNTYDLGSDPLTGGKSWKTSYIQDIVATTITSNSLIVDNIELALPQGNIYYVATNGNNANAGVHENNPLATVKHALSLATAGSTVYIYPGIYEEEFPLAVPQGVTVRGAGIRAVTIKPTTATRYNDAFLVTGETTVEDLAITDFFSGGNYFSVVTASAGSTTINVGTAPFAHAYVSGGTINISGTNYAITNATYDHTTGAVVLTHAGPDATGLTIFLSNLTFSCNGGTRVFPDNGYAFRFATDFVVTTRSPYIRNITVITRGSTTSVSDPYGFDAGDAGKGAYIDGAYANSTSREASMLFHSSTFITPNRTAISATNGARIEWLNSFTYFADKGLYLYTSNDGFAGAGLTRLRIDNRSGTWAVGNTVSYYDTDGTTVLASGTIESIDGDYFNLTGKRDGFETITDRVGKTATVNGDAKLSTAQYKFGVSSLALDGSSDYITYTSSTDFEFGTGDFCIEAFLYPTATSTYRTIFDLRSSTGDTGGIILGLSDINALYFFFNGNYRIGPVGSVPTNAWTHISLARSAGVTRAFVNGVQVGSNYADSNSYAARPIRIGADPNGNFAFTGYFDDVRITKGVARYTSNFTVSTVPLTGDLSTVLLLHFNGVNNSTTILDDGITYQDLRTSAGGTASVINFADYSDFGAEMRAIGSANVYGNYGAYGNGVGVIAYLVSQNFAYVGSGKLSTNDPNDRISANEVVELNGAHIYRTSVDNEGNFKVGNYFSVNQKTGDVEFNSQNLSITTPAGVTFTDGVNTTTITPTEITTGNIVIHDNNIDSVVGDINVTAASGVINLQNNTYVTGTLNVTGDVNIGGNIQIGDQSSDTVTFVAKINSNLIPAATATYNLGTDLLRWNTVFVSRAEIDSLVIDANTIQTTANNDNLTLTANGTGEIFIPSNNVVIDQNLTVDQNFSVLYGTSYLTDMSINGTITQTGDINQTGNFVTSGNTEVTGNITGSGYLQLPQITITGNQIYTTVTNTDLKLTANGTGNVITESIMFADNTINSVNPNSSIYLTPQGTGGVVIDSNQSLQVAVGTTAQRPDVGYAANGQIRYNTDLLRYEAYNNGYWVRLSGLEDVDGNTKILAEATPGANDNTLYFYADGNLTATIDSSRLFAQRFQTTNVDIYSNTITPITTNSDLNLTTSGTGGVRLGNLKVFNNTITNVVNNAVTEFLESGTGYVRIAGHNGVVIPSGDTQTQRPLVPEMGMMRFNTDLQLVEVYNGVTWASVAGASGGVTTSEANDLGITASLIFG